MVSDNSCCKVSTKQTAVSPGSILSVESNQNVESKTKNVESKIAFGQLILRKIIKTVPTTQNSAGAGLRPRPRCRSNYSAPQTHSWI